MPEDPAAALAGRQVVVTGAAGFLGGRLLARLAASGGRPVGLDRRPLGAVPPRASAMVADLRGSVAAAGVLQTADIVFHLAAANGHAASMENPLRDFEGNVNATLGLLRSVGPRTRVVFTGTRQLYGAAVRLPVAEDHPLQPPDAHAVHKEAAEHLGRALLGDRFRVLRLSNAYGPGQPLRGPGAGFTGAFLGAALAGEEIRILGNPALRRDPVYVDDVVDALLRAAASEAPAGPWNVGGPAVTLRDYAVRLGEAAGGPVRIRVEPLPATRQAIAVDDLLLDTSRIRRDLGWRASTPLDAGLRATVAWFRRRRRRRAGLQSGTERPGRPAPPLPGPHRENWRRTPVPRIGPQRARGTASLKPSN